MEQAADFANQSLSAHAQDRARDGTPLRDPARPEPKYRPLTALHHFRELLKDKEDTSHVFRIFEALPNKSFKTRVRNLVLSEKGERLRADEPYLPPILDDHETLRELPRGTVAHAYCDFMETEGLSAAGLVAEADKLGRRKYDDLTAWFSYRSRDTHDLMHVLTGYGRDALGEQCVLLFTHGQQPSHGHLLIGYAGALNIKKMTRGSKAPVLKAVRQAQRTGTACPALVGMSIRDLLAMNLDEARRRFAIPEPHWYRECHRIWREEGVDPYNLLATGAEEGAPQAA
ncbi:Coq4 family protein [Qipengyuania sp. JC766]|uniref:Coq4 family protein n=1 Tax=Qipengyuania sp. JC766 TaxID=3232139 RepID=UPI003459422D